MRGIPNGPLAALLATTFFFGSLSVAAKLALREVEPFALVAARLAFAGLILVALAGVRGRLAIERRDVPRVALLAALGIVLNQLLFMAGLARTTAVATTILATTIPIFTLLLGAAVGIEALTRRKLSGAALGLVGVVVLVGAAALEAVRGSSDPQVLVGDLLILLNSLSYAAYLLLSRPLVAKYGAGTVVAWTIGLGAIGVAVVASPDIVATDWTVRSTFFWVDLAWIVLACTVAAYLLPNWAMKRVPASTVASFVFLQPLVAAVLAVPLLDEALAWRHLLGGVLIAAGVWLATTTRK